MTLSVQIPGRAPLELEHVVFDVNGTLTDRGVPIDGVAERLGDVGATLGVHLLSADTFGTLEAVASSLGATPTRIETGEDKWRVVEQLGAARCAAVGNGANDAAMLEGAALGIAVIGREGAACAAIRVADVVCASIIDALDLLLDVQALRATLRP